jgi:hypothetical protein
VNDHSLNSDRTSSTIVSQMNASRQSINGWLNDKHNAMATGKIGNSYLPSALFCLLAAICRFLLRHFSPKLASFLP